MNAQPTSLLKKGLRPLLSVQILAGFLNFLPAIAGAKFRSGGDMDQPTMSPGAENSEPQVEAQSNTLGEKPFEMPPDVAPSEPMGGQAPQGSNGASRQAPAETPPPMPGKPSMGSYVFIIILVIVLLISVALFGAWQGWYKLGGLFSKTDTSPSPTVSISGQISPMISPNGVSPSPQVSSGTVSNVNDVTRKNDLAAIKLALKNYNTENGNYPTAVTLIKTSDKSSMLFQALVPKHIESLPVDPADPDKYYGINRKVKPSL